MKSKFVNKNTLFHLTLTNSNQLKIFDVKKKQKNKLTYEITQYNNQVTCFDLKNDNLTFHIALGLSTGQISVWNLSTATKLLTYNAHKGSVKTLIFTNERLLSCGNENKVQKWNLIANKNDGSIITNSTVKCLCSTNNGLLVGGSQIELFDKNFNILRHFIGHPTESINFLLSPKNSPFFFSSAQERFIKIWKRSGSSKRNVNPSHELQCISPPISFDCITNGKKYLIIALINDSKFLIWQQKFSIKKSSGSFPPQHAIYFPITSTSLTLFFDVQIVNFKQVLLVSGLLEKPIYRTIFLDNTKNDIVLKNQLSELNLNTKKKSPREFIVNMIDASINEPTANPNKRINIFPLEERIFFKSADNCLSTENIQLILSQAILMKNEIIIQQCLQLQKNQKEIIKNTVLKMPIKEVKHLFSYLCNIIQKKKNETQYISWLEQLINLKGYNLDSKILLKLDNYIEKRIEYFHPILKLKGMIDLLIKQKHKEIKLTNAEMTYVSE